MNRSKSSPSLPTIIENSEFDIKKSMSQPELTNNKHIFKLNGTHLGLSFTNTNGYAVINNIYINSSAYHKISYNYLNKYYIHTVNDFNFTTYNSIIKFINFIWSRDNEIRIELKELECYEETKLDIFYREKNIEKYRKILFDFGVYSYEDLEFLEYHDLKIMNIPDNKIQSMLETLNIKINNNIYIKNDISIQEKQRLINDFKKKSEGIIYLELSDGWISI